jgi:hypothetical protein
MSKKDSTISKTSLKEQPVLQQRINVSNPFRRLAYYCDKDCGGWADRLKGPTLNHTDSLIFFYIFVINL